MSASEKLEALDVPAPGYTDAELAVMGYDGLLVLRDALPQIVAVVEAAESIKSQSAGWGPKDDLDAALAALDKTLP